MLDKKERVYFAFFCADSALFFVIGCFNNVWRMMVMCSECGVFFSRCCM